MDQDAYRKTYQRINERACLFEKCLFAGHAGCSQSARFNLTEREGIQCTSDTAQSRCTELLNLLRHHSRFALKSSDEPGVLNHAQELRIQVGGLRGLDQVLEKRREPITVVADIHTLICHAQEQYQRLERLPFNEIIQQIAAFKGRHG